MKRRKQNKMSNQTADADCHMDEDSNILICIKDLAVAYQTNVAVFDINLDVYRHDFLGICGPNGSGKSTILKSIVGAVKPFQGNLRLFNKDVLKHEIREIQNKISYLPQIEAIDRNFPALVKDVVGMGLYTQKGFFRRLNKNDDQIVLESLETVGMANLAERPIGHLSGGQQQKVKIARALVNKPEILLVDEPFSALDFKIAKEIAELLAKIYKETEITIVLVSHNLAIIREYCTRAVCMDRRIIWEGNPKSNEFDEAVQRVFHF
ncbi:MAG: metal ABC transporter ATP-binding protein [Asgard group archaeon]|nr:metal ABC transporter ATP-binding protein [Asgard group archaeon]